MLRRIVLEADSVEEATGRMQSEMPAGYLLLITEVLSDSRSDTVRCSAATTENAYSKARHKVPKGADITSERELAAAHSERMLFDAFDEKTARVDLENRIIEGTKVQSFGLEKEGSQGFLGIGKKPNRYRAQLFHPAVVEVSYVVRARVSFTLMSPQAAEEARKAVGELSDLCDPDRSADDSVPALQEMRAIGYRLEGTGGFDLMLAAETLLLRERPEAKRLLDEAWDGIGAWIV